jgi:hypothetical protein
MSQESIQPAITFLNMTGDITISWDASNADAILALVEEKMKKENVTFFIIKPRFLSFLGKKKVAATSIKQIAEAGATVVADEDFHRMMGRLKLHDQALEAAVAAGKAHLTRSDVPVDRAAIRPAKSAQEVLQNQTIAVRRVVGG